MNRTRKVFIQDLKPKQPINLNNGFRGQYGNFTTLINGKFKEIQHARYIENVREPFDKERVYCSHSNARDYIQSSNGFISTYIHAYLNHYDCIFNVNDIWSIIAIYFSKYVNKNAEALRSKFVFHEGLKNLSIVEQADTVEEAIAMEKKWDYFFEQIICHIKQNTTEGVTELLSGDFDVSTQFDKLFSTSVIMDTFQKYFTYGRMIMGCGIPNVHLDGTLEDWHKLKEKVINLKQYSVDPSNQDDTLINYINHLEPILNNFILTYEGVVDLSFWNTIMNTEEVRIGSGGETTTYLEGWITHLYQIYKRVDIDGITEPKISFPITLTNHVTDTVKVLTLYGGFTGISYDEERNAFLPQRSMVIYHHDPTYCDNNEHNFC